MGSEVLSKQNTELTTASIRLSDVRSAQNRIGDFVLRTPLVRLNVSSLACEIYLKLENLQPTGAFKLRGAINALKLINNHDLGAGVWTVSSGNMAVALSFGAKAMGIKCSVVVSDDMPKTKLEAIKNQNAQVFQVPWEQVLEIAFTHHFDGMDGIFIHPFANPDVVAGNGTIGLEILEDLPEVDAIVVPYGGGGLTCSVGSVVKIMNPDIKVYAAEVETGAPVAPSLLAGKPVTVENVPSFVSGIGTPSVFPEVWPLASKLLDGALVSSLAEVAATVKLLAEKNHIIAEAAGATPVAAALSGGAGRGKIVCVISGGNIDVPKLVAILRGDIP